MIRRGGVTDVQWILPRLEIKCLISIQHFTAWISNIVQYNLYVYIYIYIEGGRVGVGVCVCCTIIRRSVTCIRFLCSTLKISAESIA